MTYPGHQHDNEPIVPCPVCAHYEIRAEVRLGIVDEAAYLQEASQLEGA